MKGTESGDIVWPVVPSESTDLAVSCYFVSRTLDSAFEDL